jgi:hypothetical protein
MSGPAYYYRNVNCFEDRIMMDETNEGVAAEVEAAFRRYETALVAGDTAVMGDLFWTSPDVSRFGAGDYQVGSDELAAFRSKRGPLASGRQLEDTRIVTFGQNAAVVTTLFRSPGVPTLGRQSQTWIRLEGEWQIVHAHVSQIPDPH